MKKLLYCAAALATMFFTACQQENLEPADMGTTVSFEVKVPGLAHTKSGANVADNGININDLVYAVYKTDKTTEAEALETLTAGMRIYQRNQGKGETSFNGGVTKVQLELLNDQNYVVLFWAQVDDAWVKPDTDAQKFDLLNITYPTSMNANDEKLEAFSGFAFIAADDVDGGLKRRVTLTRPFAQINVGTLEPTAFDEFSFVNSNIVVRNAGDNFNVATQTATTTRGDDNDLTFKANEIPGGKLYVDDKETEYTYAGMNYVFANDTKANVILTYNITTNHGLVTNTIPSVPVAQNFRTNIIGNLLTSNATYEVKLDNRWNTPNEAPDEVIEVWNGSEVNKPKKSATKENVYEIEFPSELAWLAAAVNGTLQTKSTEPAESFAGKTFMLTEDIDLNGFEWTPIGSGSNIFKGTFDGQNHTVKNLKISGNNSTVGLFGSTHDGEIKNLVVENAEVSGRLNVGVVAGNPYTSKYTNITVKGLVKVEGMAYVGGVGGKNAYADWTNITVSVDKEKSYVKANSVENGTAYRTYVGGVVGFNGEGGHSFKNITSNIDVKGSTCDVGGLFGIAHYGNQFENCSCSGDVEIYAAEEAAEAEEIGGIAGVWHNETGMTVTMKNVSFEGDVNTNVERATVWYGDLVGKPYNATGEGILSLNGNNFKVSGVVLNDINESLKSGNFVFPFDLEGVAAASNSYGNTGLNQLNGGVIDGDGHTLTVTGANATWSSAINTTGGTIKNLTIASGFRGIFVNHNSTHAEKVILENVTIHGPTYTISCDQGTGNGLEATECTLNGWTSYAATIGDVKFTNCSFGNGAGYKFARPYAPTTFVNCDFCEGYVVDPRAKVVFENCRLNGVEITEDNYTQLVTSNSQNVAWVAKVGTSEELTTALNGGKDVVLTGDVISEAATTAPYGNKYAFKLDGGVLDGNGHELHMDCYGDDYGIMTSGGTIKNLTIKEGCRAVMIMYPQQDVILDNVNIGGDGVLYPINTGEAGAEGVKLIVKNSVLAGWTSFGLIESATFTNVEFKQGTYYNNIYGRVLKPYVNTTMTNCSFVEHMNLDLSSLTGGHKVTMKNCTVNGQAVTAEVCSIPTTDAQYDTELFTVDLPSWASSVNECVIFE